MDLQGRVVLITGGRRVGLDLARILADRGAKLAMTYHTSRRTIEEGLRVLGVESLAISADLSRPEEADLAIEAVLNRFGRLDVLVNMVSLFERVAFDDLTADHYHAMIAANLTAPYFSAVASARAIRCNSPNENGLRGKIVNIGDWSIDRPGKGMLPYITAKGGLKTLTLALARELAPDVTVNLIEPGTIEPPPGSSPAQIRSIETQTPLGRIGSPGDVNRLILYLLEGSDFVTGSSFRVDGGRFLGTETVE